MLLKESHPANLNRKKIEPLLKSYLIVVSL